MDVEEELYLNIPPAVMDVASDARDALRQAVPILPLPLSETVIRSFGRLCVQYPGGSSGSTKNNGSEGRGRSNKFSTSSALYPVGFSCNRYDFSPVHGRLLNMRCSILDGRSIKAKQTEIIRVNAGNNVHDGPVYCLYANHCAHVLAHGKFYGLVD